MEHLSELVLKKFPKLCSYGVVFLKEHEKSSVETIVTDPRMTLERFIFYMSAVGVSRKMIQNILDGVIDSIDRTPLWRPDVFKIIKDKELRYSTDYSTLDIFNEAVDNNFFQLVGIVSHMLDRKVLQEIRTPMERLVITGYYKKIMSWEHQTKRIYTLSFEYGLG